MFAISDARARVYSGVSPRADAESGAFNLQQMREIGKTLPTPPVFKGVKQIYR